MVHRVAAVTFAFGLGIVTVCRPLLTKFHALIDYLTNYFLLQFTCVVHTHSVNPVSMHGTECENSRQECFMLTIVVPLEKEVLVWPPTEQVLHRAPQNQLFVSLICTYTK